MNSKPIVLDRKKGPTKKYSLGVVNLAEAHNDPPIREVKSTKGEEFVLYGEKNDYYDNVILRYLGSPTNSRCINGMVDMIYGRGLSATNQEEMFKKDIARMGILFNSHELKRVIGDLKQLGQGTAQVVYNKDKSKIIRFEHTPTECWRAGRAQDGIIKKYYYHPKWKDYEQRDKLKALPTFGHGSDKDLVELYIFRPYTPGFYYYSPVDYHGCLQYCELEEEVSNYHLNNIQGGLNPSVIINFNNGVPSEEQQHALEQKIMDKFSGTNGQKFVLQFNDDPETASTVDPISIPDIHAQYQFLADEAREKIMLGHGIVSPILLGIKDNTGFGNNAEELRTSSVLMDNMVVRPFQDIMLDGINEILAFNKVVLNTYFITLQPIEFTEVDKIETKVRREEETGEKLSAIEKELSSIREEFSSVQLTDIDEDQGNDLLSQLEGLGEHISDEWELVHSEVVKDAEKPFKMPEALSDANPNKESSQDQGIFKVRYAYMPVRKSPDSRDFCKRMEKFTSNNTVFRKEDIDQMSFRGVNKQLGHKKQNYSLFKFKGGKNCHHYWELRVYKKKVGARSEVDESNIDPVNNPSEVRTRPIDMPGKGAHPSTLKKIRFKWPKLFS